MNKKMIKRKVLRTKPRPLPEFKYDIKTSVKFLLSCAKQRQFISYIEFNRFFKIPDQDWPILIRDFKKPIKLYVRYKLALLRARQEKFHRCFNIVFKFRKGARFSSQHFSFDHFFIHSIFFARLFPSYFISCITG